MSLGYQWTVSVKWTMTICPFSGEQIKLIDIKNKVIYGDYL